jgi:hydroxymethylbilane synthase
MHKVTIATRGSRLALWQANHIKDRIEAHHRARRWNCC